MTRKSTVVLFTCVSLQSFGQDTIAKLSGEKLFVKVLANTTNTVDFSYPNETATNSLPRTLVKYVVFASGRKEPVSELIDINGPDGWRNVQLTNNPDEVIGLVRLGEVSAKASNAAGVMSASGVDSRASEKIKREAALLGAHIVLAQQNATSGSSFRSTAKSFKSGIAYGYPFKNLEQSTLSAEEQARRFYALQKANGGMDEPAVIKGQKVVFEHEGNFCEGEIVKRNGNFYKIKFINKKGKEDTVSEHVDKVAFVVAK